MIPFENSKANPYRGMNTNNILAELMGTPQSILSGYWSDYYPNFLNSQQEKNMYGAAPTDSYEELMRLIRSYNLGNGGAV